MASRLLGFRDYHEAHSRLTTRELLEDLAKEPGGLLAYSGVAFDMVPHVLDVHGVVTVEGVSGSGKSTICFELVTRALAMGRPVRILGFGRSYWRLTQMLGGLYYEGPPSGEALAAWSSDAPLVTFDADELKHCSAFCFSNLETLPKNALVVCDEFYGFRSVYRPLANARTTILTSQDGKVLPPADHRLVFDNRHQDYQGQRWSWHVGERFIDVKMSVGPRRWGVFFALAKDVPKIGGAYDAKVLDAFVASLSPQLRQRPASTVKRSD